MMRVYSNDFNHNEQLNKRHTCDAEDISPHLKWEDIPQGTKSFAISCINNDTKHGTLGHWYVYNIPSDTREIPRAGPIPGIEIENDFGNIGYEGPNFPSEIHSYIFTIYALDVKELNDLTPINFRRKVHKHTIEKADIIGKYEREFDFRDFQKMSCH